jgi:hypothetical protein
VGVRIVFTETVTKQPVAHVKSDFRYLDRPFSQPLSPCIGILIKRITLEHPSKLDNLCSFLRGRRPASIGLMTLKGTDQRHPGYDRPATQLHFSSLACARLKIVW